MSRTHTAFTLIELLVVMGVIGVLMTATLVAVNPSRQFCMSENARRVQGVRSIDSAIQQYVISRLPSGDVNTNNLSTLGYTGGNIGMIPACSSGVVEIGTDTAGGTFDLSALLVPNHIATIPLDTASNTQAHTGYTLCVRTPTTLTLKVQSMMYDATCDTSGDPGEYIAGATATPTFTQTPTPTNTPTITPPPPSGSVNASLSSVLVGNGTTLTADFSAPTTPVSADIRVTTTSQTLPSGCSPANVDGVWCILARSTTSPFSVGWFPAAGGSYTAIVNVYENATYTYAPDWSCTGNPYMTPGPGNWRDCGVSDNVTITATNPTATPTPTPTHTPTNTPTNTLTPTNTPTPSPYPTVTPTVGASTIANDTSVRLAYTAPSTPYAAVGSSVVYVVTVVNPSGSNRYAIGTFTDTIPTGLTGATWTCAITAAGVRQGQGPNSSCGAASGSGNLSFSLTLNPGATASITISAQVASGAPSTITDTASYYPNLYYQSSTSCYCLDFDCQTCWSQNNAGAEGYPANNTASVTLNTYTPTPLPTAPAPPFPTLTPTAAPGTTANDIYLSKAQTTPNAVYVARGAAISYAMDVSFPAGSNRVATATFLDTLPASITSTTWSCSVIAAGTPVANGAATSCGTSGGSGSINTNITLEPGSKIRFIVNGTVSTGATGTISNTALLTNVVLSYHQSSSCYCLDFDCQTCWSTVNTGPDANSANNSMTIATGTY